MIAFVKGYLVEMNDSMCVVDVNGMGINVNISSLTASFLPPVGEEVKLHTYTSVREDAFQLFGFLSRDELMLFKKLITVNGVGPKAGLSILSLGNPEDIRFAILSGDVKLISGASGVGKKTAERIVLELKDKLDWNAEMISRDIGKSSLGNGKSLNDPARKESYEALIALGYSASDAGKVLESIDISEDMSSEDILKEALKKLL